MQTCGTCKFWGNIKGEPEQTGRFRQCGRVSHDEDRFYCHDEIGEWMSDSDMRATLNIHKELAVVVDGSGYFAALKCQSDFGCVLHEEKNS